jgi:hypothetical protein
MYPAVSYFQTRDGGLGGWVCPLTGPLHLKTQALSSPLYLETMALMLWIKAAKLLDGLATNLAAGFLIEF